MIPLHTSLPTGCSGIQRRYAELALLAGSCHHPSVSWQCAECRNEEPCRNARAALGPPVPAHRAVTIAIVQTPHGGLPHSAPAPNGTQPILAWLAAGGGSTAGYVPPTPVNLHTISRRSAAVPHESGLL